LGKEGPLVHTGACIASVLGQVNSLSESYLQLLQSYSIVKFEVVWLDNGSSRIS